MEKDLKEGKKEMMYLGGESGPGRKNSLCKGPRAKTRTSAVHQPKGCECG